MNERTYAHAPKQTESMPITKAPKSISRHKPVRLQTASLKSISKPGDTFEQEAESVAARMGKSPAPDFPFALRSRSHVALPPLNDVPPSVEQTLQSPGQPLELPIRALMEPRFRHDFSGVRVHTDPQAQKSAHDVDAHAYTVGEDVVFGNAQFDPSSPRGQRLIAHELTHVVQQSEQRATPTVQRQEAIDVELVSSVTEYTSPRTGRTHRLGEAAGFSILSHIDSFSGGEVTFHWFNFNLGRAQSGPIENWEILQFASGIAGRSPFEQVGAQLTAAQWEALGSDPTAGLLKMYEEGRISLPDEAVLTTYKGMINREAENRLDENEKAINSILDAPDRVRQLEEYSTGLKEASRVRDVLETRRDELEHRLVQQHSFTFGFAGNMMNFDPYYRLQIFQQLDPVERALQFWYQAFPLLTRLKSGYINSATVEDTLQGIKANIIATRADLARSTREEGPLDRLNMVSIRERIAPQVGARTNAVVADEERSRRRWSWVRAIGQLALGVALLFLPGGVFIDAAIGLALAGETLNDAITIGRAANTGLHVDDGLMTQSQASMALLGAVMSTVFAVIGAGAAGFQVLRVGRLFFQVSETAPELAAGSRMSIARILASNPQLLSKVRTTAELETLMESLGKNLSFEEIQAIRVLAYRKLGLNPVAQSRESLNEFLQRVWRDKAQITSPRGVYRLYSGATEANPLTQAPGEYLGNIAEIASGRPPEAISNIQGLTTPKIGDQISAVVRAAGTQPGQKVAGAFYRFERAEADLSKVTERIYLNVRADNATEVMRHVVRHIIDNPNEFPGVAMAKLTGPGGVAARADAIVIYAENEAASARVLNNLRSYRRANPGLFQKTTPPMTQGVLEGVSTASEPAGFGGTVSFGEVRADVIYKALSTSVHSHESYEEFVEHALEALRAAGINPDAPHLNL